MMRSTRRLGQTDVVLLTTTTTEHSGILDAIVSGFGRPSPT
jgi:hypothetical protein